MNSDADVSSTILWPFHPRFSRIGLEVASWSGPRARARISAEEFNQYIPTQQDSLLIHTGSNQAKKQNFKSRQISTQTQTIWSSFDLTEVFGIMRSN